MESKVDTVCIAVHTPLDIYKQPDLSYVENSTRSVGITLIIEI